MNFRNLTRILALSLIFLIQFAYSQPRGKLLIKNFNQLEIGSDNGAFWAVVKDKRGILYFGGEGNIFEFDGISWRGIVIPNHSVARSLCVDNKGVIYVGAVGDFGYLAPDLHGEMRFTSLLQKVPANKLDFADVWSVNSIDDRVFFQTESQLFEYSKNSIKTWETENSYHRSFVINNKLIFNQRGVGLSVLENNEIKIVKSGEFFKDKVISSITHYTGNKYLIGTRTDGLFLVDFEQSSVITPFNCEANNFLKEKQIYCGLELPDGKQAFTTMFGGAVIINRTGNIENVINKLNGFLDNTAYYINLFEGNELWITSSKGVGVFNINSPLSFWNDELGISGVPDAVLVKNNRIYVGTQTGLYYYDAKTSTDESKKYVPGSFKSFNNLSTEVWDLIMLHFPVNSGKTQDIPLAITGQGLYNIETQKFEFPNKTNGELTLCQSSINPTIVYLSTHSVFYVLQYIDNKWNIIWGQKVSPYITSIAEDANGDVWIGTRFYGIYKLNLSDFFISGGNDIKKRFTAKNLENVKLDHYNVLSGLPNINLCEVLSYKNHVVISCEGLYSFDSNSKKFVKTDIFGEEIKNWNRTVSDLKEDKFGNLWGFQSEILDKQPDGTFKIAKLPYWIFTVKNSTLAYFHEDNGTTWIAGEHGLYKFQSNSISSEKKDSFSVHIRKVSIDNDSVLFYGTNFETKNDKLFSSLVQPKELVPELTVHNRSIIFNYACPYFHDDIPLEYSYYLEGYDNKWSDWTTETKKEYNNLREKTYVFQVKARNYNGVISKTASYKFIINPPWYRTIVAYFIYFLIIVGVFWGSIKVNSIRLRKYSILLENKVKDRTKTLLQQKNEINSQAEKLKSQNDKLMHHRNRLTELSKEINETNKNKLKFFTNISHELRTPLTLIMGPSEELLNKSDSMKENERKNLYSIIHRNTSRLLTLINQILDFRKIEEQEQKVQASEGDMVKFIENIADYFKELSLKSNIDYVFSSSQTCLETWFDKDKIEKIIFNLISNAFKYTKESGNISVEIKLTKEELLKDYKGECIVISVKDNGVGISENNKSKIFDWFYQSGKSLSLDQAGSGIGLSMCVVLAEAHHGKITVESKENEGSTFSLVIPFGKDYLAENELSKTGDNEQESILAQHKNKKYKYINLKDTINEPLSERNPDKNLILIVEDSEDIRSFIKQSLSKSYDFIEAGDGEVGLKMAREYNPDLIILDVMMPKMDGYEFCTQTRKDIEISHIPIIMLTSKSTIADQKIGLETGADDYITKPFNINLLNIRITNLIKSRQELRERYSKEIVVKPTEVVIASVDEKFLNKAIKMVETNISDPTYDIDKFCKDMAMSQSSLYRKLKYLTGDSGNNFIKDIRLKRAASLLAQNEITISEIAKMVGFDDAAYFSKVFKLKFSLSPTDYAKKFL